MTTLIHDAKAVLAAQGVTTTDTMFCNELLYADDTLITDTDADVVHAFMLAIESAGASYGLALHWGKVELLPVRSSCTIRAPNGHEIVKKDSIKYLGALLSSDGRIHSELARRIGAASADFKAIKRVWHHSTLSTHRKMKVFNACILSRAVYGLQTAWMNKAERRRIDGFPTRCLREILRIPHAYYSQISNDAIFQQAGAKPLSRQVLEQRLIYLHKVANLPSSSPIRASIC